MVEIEPALVLRWLHVIGATVLPDSPFVGRTLRDLDFLKRFGAVVVGIRRDGHLVDGDLASNNHGWQWAAGTGTDAAPYFRVFNPTLQQERYDPDGDYVARWVPNPVEPMLDHKAERNEALRRLKSLS